MSQGLSYLPVLSFLVPMAPMSPPPMPQLKIATKTLKVTMTVAKTKMETIWNTIMNTIIMVTVRSTPMAMDIASANMLRTAASDLTGKITRIPDQMEKAPVQMSLTETGPMDITVAARATGIMTTTDTGIMAHIPTKMARRTRIATADAHIAAMARAIGVVRTAVITEFLR